MSNGRIVVFLGPREAARAEVGLPATATDAELEQRKAELEAKRKAQLATEEINAAIKARQIGNSTLSQDHFLRALSHGASKSDPRLNDLPQWLFHENVRSKVSAATISGDLFEVEVEISLAQKCKYPDDQHLNRLIDLRKPCSRSLSLTWPVPLTGEHWTSRALPSFVTASSSSV